MQVVYWQELEEVKKAKVSLEEKLELEASCHAAMEKHNFQLNNLVQQLEDGVTKYETKIGAEKGKSVAPNHTWLLKLITGIRGTNCALQIVCDKLSDIAICYTI
jgi:hypothetical protein